MKAIIMLLTMALAACAGYPDCQTQARAVVPTYADSIGDMVAAIEVEQRCLAR